MKNEAILWIVDTDTKVMNKFKKKHFSLAVSILFLAGLFAFLIS